ncbi:MAG: acyl-CoA/acyl-ACP dehydrogenase [Planctomycetes bacterium]|nr:acyl-CoA/acyl-ACP dehydrogenase [Planctomycetota bacterium]
MSSNTPDSPSSQPSSTAAQALAAAGDAESARDVGALDDAARQAALRLGAHKQGLVERLIYGPLPETDELQSGANGAARVDRSAGDEVVAAALQSLARGEAFTADGKLSATLRQEVAAAGGYGFTVPKEFGGKECEYTQLALVEEEMAANGLGPLAVEISGELTIGAGSLLAYGTDEQKRTFLPLVSDGELMAFGLTEVGIGVNAKKVRAYVEPDGDGYRLFAHGDRNKLWITNATHGGLVGIVARIGETGRKVGLFVMRLPEHDVQRDGEHDHEFWCQSSNTGAFTANHNARLHFDNFPLSRDQEIQADGVEVLFYCLRMGRCMLAAMAAGYQRMFAADAAAYAKGREGVGGQVVKHELPRQHLGKMLGGALMSRALSHLSLRQDKAGVDLAGLRDLTKSAAATSALDSQIACERVLGGRSFDKTSRVHDARHNMHVFGVVEGEDDLILMGMVKDVTDRFTTRYMAGMLGVLQSLNVDADGKPLPRDQRILRITPATVFDKPGKVWTATRRLLGNGSFYKLAGWIVGNGVVELLRLPFRLVPTSMCPRYQLLPSQLAGYARFAERRLRWLRWAYLGINLHFQLELTRAQIPLQRLGKVIELLVSMLAVAHHAASTRDQSQIRVAALQCEQLMTRVKGMRLLTGLWQMDRLRRHVAAVGDDVEKGHCSLLADVEPQPFAHPFEPQGGKPRRG